MIRVKLRTRVLVNHWHKAATLCIRSLLKAQKIYITCQRSILHVLKLVQTGIMADKMKLECKMPFLREFRG